MSELISEIQAFCKAHRLTETDFGEKAMNDRPFVGQLRKGRDLRLSTVERIRAFMANYKPDEAA